MWPRLARAKADTWAKMTDAQRGELLWAADGLSWGWLDELVEAADAPPAGALIWQVRGGGCWLLQWSEGIEFCGAVTDRCGRPSVRRGAPLRQLMADEEALAPVINQTHTENTFNR